MTSPNTLERTARDQPPDGESRARLQFYEVRVVQLMDVPGAYATRSGMSSRPCFKRSREDLAL